METDMLKDAWGGGKALEHA